MKHPHEEWLALEATGDLGVVRGFLVRRHVSQCAECRETVQGYAGLSAEYSRLPRPEPPVELDARLLTRVPVAPQPSFAFWPRAVAATGVLAALGIVLMLNNSQPPAPIATVAKKAVVDLPPVELVQTDTTLTVRNRSTKVVAGVAAGSTSTGVHLAPGESVSLPARPQGNVEVDAVLFLDGTTYGPDKSGALTPLRINRAEADRDRRYLAALRDTSQIAAAMEQWESDAGRQSKTLPKTLVGPRAEVLRGHALPAKVEVVALPGAPVEIVSAEGSFGQGRLMDPTAEVRNSGSDGVKQYQLIWVFRDASGAEFRGRLSASATRSAVLEPGARVRFSEPIAFETGGRGHDREIVSAKVFVRAVEFADDRIWVPARTDLDHLRLAAFLPLSTETERLLAAYRQQGVKALVAELHTLK